jgi:hypothetical protein
MQQFGGEVEAGSGQRVRLGTPGQRVIETVDPVRHRVAVFEKPCDGRCQWLWADRVQDLIGAPPGCEHPSQHLPQGCPVPRRRLAGQQVPQRRGLAVQVRGDAPQLGFADPVHDLALELQRARCVDDGTGHDVPVPHFAAVSERDRR